MRGTIKVVNAEKGFAFITPEDGTPDVHLKLATTKLAPLLRRGLHVEFEVVSSGADRWSATNLCAIDEDEIAVHSSAGRVKFWDDDKGFGFATTDAGRDVYLARRSTTFTDGVTPADGDEVQVDFVDTGEKNPVCVRLTITKLADWKPTGIPLLDFADVGQRSQMVADLASLAEPEPWDNTHEPTGGMPILDSYLRFTFTRLREEGKVVTSADALYTAFNTGLVTHLQEEIFALFSANATKGRQPWQLLGFRKKSDRLFLEKFGDRLPELANYFDDPAVLLYDRRLQLHINIDHVIEHLERFPEPLRTNEFLARQAVTAAEANTRSRVYRNYKAAIPQWYKDSHSGVSTIQLLLPLCLNQPDRADLALVVDKVGNSYRGNTVLTLDMAYRNARLITRPDSDWLRP